jgi:hypothetical protein
MLRTLGQELYCRFEGNANDSSGNGRNGTVSGATLVPTAPFITQNIKGSLFSDGTGDYITVPNTATVASATKVTMFAWVRLYSYNTTTAFSPIYMEQTASSTFARCALRIGGTTSEGLLNVGWRQSANEPTGTQFNLTGTNKLALNTPYFVMATIDTTTNEQKLYINDSLEATGSQSTGAFGSSTTNGIEIARNGGAQVLNGAVGKVGICIGEILDLDDAEEIYNNGNGLTATELNTYLGSKLTSLWDLQTDYIDKKGTNHATAVGNTYLTPPFGRAYIFDGVDDEIDFGTTIAFSPSSLTVSAWVNPTNLTNTNTILEKWIGINGQRSWRFFIQPSTGTLRTNISHDGNTNGTVDSVTAISTNTWTHVAFTRTGDTTKIYINGVLDNTGTTGGSGVFSQTVSSLKVGYGGSSIRVFAGVIDEPVIFSRVLSAEDIKRLMMGMHPLN